MALSFQISSKNELDISSWVYFPSAHFKEIVGQQIVKFD